MRKYKLGLYEKSMPSSLSFEEMFMAGKAAGFDCLEMSVDETDSRLSRLDWSKEERKNLLMLSKSLDFSVDSMCLSGHRRFPIGSGNPETEKKGMEIMEKAIHLAYDMGIRIIQLAGYDIYYDEVSTPSTRERFMQNLYKSTKMAAANGVVLALETMENDFMNTVEKAMYFVNNINSPYLKVYPDIGNVTNATDNVAYDLRTGKGNIAAIHLKETVPGVFRDMKFGEGRVDFDLAANLMNELDIRLCTAEFWYDGGEDWKEQLEKANSFLRGYLDRGIK